MKILLCFISFLYTVSVYSQQDVPIGTVMAYAGDTALLDKTRWRVCDGTSLKIDEQLDLFKAIGWRYGYGSDVVGRKTYSLPDYRGSFLRGVDMGSGNDPDAKERRLHYNKNVIAGDRVGSRQTDTLKLHKHDINDPKHTHRVAGGWSVDDPSDHKKGGGELTNGGLSLGDWFSTEAPTNITIKDFGGAETRPINISVFWIIKIR